MVAYRYWQQLYVVLLNMTFTFQPDASVSGFSRNLSGIYGAMYPFAQRLRQMQIFLLWTSGYLTAIIKPLGNSLAFACSGQVDVSAIFYPGKIPGCITYNGKPTMNQVFHLLLSVEESIG